MNKLNYRRHIPLVALVLLTLFAGMWAGLLRLNWQWPLLRPTLPIAHGPLMVAGFLGTLIGLERAIALDLRWTYVGPVLTGLGAVLLIVGVSGSLGPLLIALGSLGLMAVFVLIIRRQPALFTATMGLGALIWLAGNTLWLAGRPIPLVVFWWMGFLVLSIVGERLELSRLLRLSSMGYITFLLDTLLLLIGVTVTEMDLDLGTRLAGAGMLALAFWLLRHDIARRTVRQSGLTRFIGVCLLSGYVWLGISGFLALRFGGMVAGPRYDAMLHALFLGFVFAMIFGHAPIMFPALLGVAITFRLTFYMHLILLHLSLALRVIGDLTLWAPGRQWGGLLNVVVIILFLANIAYAGLRPVEESTAPSA